MDRWVFGQQPIQELETELCVNAVKATLLVQPAPFRISPRRKPNVDNDTVERLHPQKVRCRRDILGEAELELGAKEQWTYQIAQLQASAVFNPEDGRLFHECSMTINKLEECTM